MAQRKPTKGPAKAPKTAPKKAAPAKSKRTVCGMPHKKCGNTCGLRKDHGGSCWCVPCQKDF